MLRGKIPEGGKGRLRRQRQAGVPAGLQREYIGSPKLWISGLDGGKGIMQKLPVSPWLPEAGADTCPQELWSR